MTSEGTLDDIYFEWLYSLVASVRSRNPRRTHWYLCKQMYTKPFTWSIRNDENRAMDGIELRNEFVDHVGLEDVDSSWMELECSFLEMLIALARRASFEAGLEPSEWFWKLIENLELWQYTDFRYTEVTEIKINEVMERVIHRKYNRDGSGGLFPLSHTREDQRKVELWYQLSAYILEGEFVGIGA